MRNRAFAVLFGAEAQSIVGDQLARVALSVLVFDRTGNAAATAVTYAATFLPAILGGLLLARLGDRFPRRRVMVACDLGRAALFLVMALPGIPLWAMFVPLIAAVFLGPAFSASEVSYLAGALTPDGFRSATGIRMTASQTAQVGGFAVGGVLVTAISPRGALAIDAATYAISALVIAALLRPKARMPARAGQPQFVAPPRQGGAISIWRDRRLRGLVMLSALAGCFVVPEGLAVPFGAQTGASTAQSGLLLAAIPLGAAIGAAVLVRSRRTGGVQLAQVMAIGCGLPLVLSGFMPHWPLALVCWFLSGALSAYQVEVMTAIAQAVSDTVRTHVLGIASSILIAVQGLGLIIFGGAAQLTSPGTATALAGIVGTGLAVLLTLRGFEDRPPVAAGAGIGRPTGAHFRS
jgi:predicted MFS family arabinose efflux permease